MRLKYIVCKAIQREAYYCAARSANIVDVVIMPQGLHNEPDKLRSQVQAEVDRIVDIQERPYDAILLGYGLCSNGIADIKAPAIPIVVARGHDCITLLLGSKELYQSYFDSHRGIYWYSTGWIENSLQPGKERYEQTLQSYKEKYGDDNAEYLMQMEQNWFKEYSWATFIDWGLVDSAKYRQYTKECAAYLKWNYDELKGDKSLLQKMVDGQWDNDLFLVVKPGKKISPDVNNRGIIKAVDIPCA
ncbi:MAG: DUF1638 domain-containing protein [Kiritimatiellaeota bacterium]|nr:DUF1638 domain-containing protein [Kiritimatiellota bacterium]